MVTSVSLRGDERQRAVGATSGGDGLRDAAPSLDRWTRPDQTRCVAQEIVNISDAKAQLSRLIEDVRRGKTVIIGKAGKPVAKLVACEPGDEPRVPGALRGKVLIADDFDELPADIAAALGMVDEP